MSSKSNRSGLNFIVEPNPPNLNVQRQVIQEMSDLRSQVNNLQRRTGKLQNQAAMNGQGVLDLQNKAANLQDMAAMNRQEIQQNKNKIEEFKEYLESFMNQVKDALKSVGSLKQPIGKIYTELGKGVDRGKEFATAAYGSAKENSGNVFLVVLVIVILLFLLYFFMKEKSIEENTEKIEENKDRIDELERKEPEIVYVPQVAEQPQRDNKSTYIILASFLALLYFIR